MIQEDPAIKPALSEKTNKESSDSEGMEAESENMEKVAQLYLETKVRHKKHQRSHLQKLPQCLLHFDYNCAFRHQLNRLKGKSLRAC